MRKIISVMLTAAVLSSNVVYAATVSEVMSISAGASIEEVHQMLGEPQSRTAQGEKEVYGLDGGARAVLRYSDDTLDMGFILF